MSVLKRFKQALQDACKNGTLVRSWTCDLDRADWGRSKYTYRKVRLVRSRWAALSGWDDTTSLDMRKSCRMDYPRASEIKELDGTFIIRDEECPRFARYYYFTNLIEEEPQT